MSSPSLAAMGFTASRIWACGPAVTPTLMVSADTPEAKAMAAAPASREASERKRSISNTPRYFLVRTSDYAC